MIKGLLPILYTSAGVTAAGVTGYAVLAPQFEEAPAPVAIEQPAAEPEKSEVASLSTEQKTNEPVAKAPEPVQVAPPAFTLLRVEKDGSTVIAGTGPANSDVTLYDGEEEIGTTNSGPTGDFAFVLDKPLAPGAHELHLSAKPKDGEAIASVEAGLINVPEPEVDEEPTVLVSAEGQATRVLQKPEPAPEPEQEVVATAQETVTVAKKEEPVAEPQPEPEETTVAAVAEPEAEEQAEQPQSVEPEPEVAAVEAPEEEAEPAPAPVKPVLIEAADIEKGRIYIAGTGEPGSTVSIYLENELLGDTTVGSNGAFLFEGDKNIDAGQYSIRADMIDNQQAKVVARAEVRLIHEPQVVVEAPKPKEEEVAKAEPAEEPKPAEVVEETPKEETPKEVASAPKEPEPAVEPVAEETETALQEPDEVNIPVIRTGSAVIIRRGDNLWQVARRNYGSGIRYTTIFEANRDQVRDPDLIYPGQVLKVPENQQAQTGTSNG